MKYTITGTVPQRSVQWEGHASTPADAVKQFRRMFEQATVETIDGVFVRGLCEGCATPILENTTKYTYNSEDSVYVCATCAKAMQQEADNESRG
jgi:RNase P subunit RPR2